MVRIAGRPRPPFVGALLLTGIAAISWAEKHPPCVTAMTIDVAASAECSELCIESVPPASGDAIVLTPWDRIQLGPQHFEILRPPVHPDAQDWPRGMVIGRHTPSVDPGIQVFFGSPVANVMSVFLAPWRALAGQLGT
jgi:hypothetical protein